ncbi:MAG: CRISPR-associated protein [Cyanothece sp. SIO2G6]|nr:CRISPR-associated protein [Cyanothece sp. SIO2G6]
MKRNRIATMVTDPTRNFLTSFMVGTLLFGIVADGISNLFWDLFKRWGTQLPLPIAYTWFRAGMTATMVLLILALIYGTNFSHWLRKWLSWLPFVSTLPMQATIKPLDRTYTGLIVSMSPKPDSPAERVIRHHWNNGQKPHLQHCWVICTDKSLPYAQEMVKALTHDGITQTVEIHYGQYDLGGDDPADSPMSLWVADERMDDPKHIQQLVDRIYLDAEAKGVDETEVIADYTGATKGMTAGILLACLAPERQLQYISQIQFPQIMAVHVSYRLKRID